MTVDQRKYTGVYHRPLDLLGNIAPLYEVAESFSALPRLRTQIAPYLPVLMWHKQIEEYFVLPTPGKVLAFDNFGFLTLAGFKRQIDACIDQDTLNPTGIVLTKYSAEDVAAGVCNSMGVPVEAGEPVVASMIDKDSGVASHGGFEVTGDTIVDGNGDTVRDTKTLAISLPMGVSPRPVTRYPWKWGLAVDTWLPVNEAKDKKGVESPTDLREHNFTVYNPFLSVLWSQFVKYPVVNESTVVSGIRLPGAALANTKGGSFNKRDYVTFDERSDLVLYGEYYNADASEVIGFITDKTSLFPKADLNRVKTRYPLSKPEFANMIDLDAMPGSATNGLPGNIYKASGSALLGEIVVKLTIAGH